MMHGARDDFLASAALTGNQHRGIRTRDPACRRDEPPHGRRCDHRLHPQKFLMIGFGVMWLGNGIFLLLVVSTSGRRNWLSFQPLERQGLVLETIGECSRRHFVTSLANVTHYSFQALILIQPIDLSM